MKQVELMSSKVALNPEKFSKSSPITQKSDKWFVNYYMPLLLASNLLIKLGLDHLLAFFHEISWVINYWNDY